MAKLTSLIEHAQRQRVTAPAPQTTDIAAIVMAGQAAMADVITRNFSGEISDKVQAKVKAEVASCMDGMAARIEASVLARVDTLIKNAVASLPAPEKVVERVIERIEREEDDEPKTITVQRKDGLIAGVKVGDDAYTVIRNKQGLIKEVRLA